MKRVTVLMGGLSAEREVSLASGANCAAALKEAEAMAASTAEKAASFMSPGSGALNAMFGVIDEETIETIDA